MAEVKEQKQQNLDNIKLVAKLNTDGLVPSLFREVKKAKQQLSSFYDGLREKYNTIKKEKELVQKQEALKAEKAKLEEKIIKEPVVETKVQSQPIQKQEQKPSQPQQQPSQKPQQRQVWQQSNQKGSQRPEGKFNNQDRGPRAQQGQDRPRFNNNQPNGRFNNNNNNQGQRLNPNNKFNGPKPAKPMGPKPAFGSAKTAKADLTSAASVFVNKERDYSNKKKSVEKPFEEKRLSKKSLLNRGLIEERNIEERMVARKLKIKKPKQEVQQVYTPITNAVITTPNLTVKMLSEKIGKPVTEIIKQLMGLGIMATINSTLDLTAAELVAGELGITLEIKLDKTYEEQLSENAKEVEDEKNLQRRPPIVTVMGHVDHGKTSLLDYIRKTNVISSEAGGITQHIGAYSITCNNESITFIDTPGHAAFTNMRARGAQITDLAILVVAADDGVKPQTVEAISHIKAAKVPMIVAINKVDKPEANIDRIKQQLTEYEVLPEEWGGDAIMVPISAKTGAGIDKLLEMILLVAEMQDLRANKDRSAVATVIEARLDKGKGPVANIIVQNGTLNIGDTVVSGFCFGRIRAMIDDKGKNITKAGPSCPVSILGFDNVPNVGDQVQAVDEKLSKNVINERKAKMANEKAERGLGTSLDDFLKHSPNEDKKVLNLIIKSDVQGSAEALKQMLSEVNNEEAEVKVIHSAVGAVTETDVQLAQVSNAIIIGFNIKPDNKALALAEHNKVEIRLYSIIYEALDDVERAIKGMVAPKYEEKVVGHAEVRMLFKISSIGTVAGCRVLDGKIVRNGLVKVLRKDNVIFEGKIATLKKEKDDAKEVLAGFECGIKVDGFNDILEGDIIECSVKEKIAIE